MKAEYMRIYYPYNIALFLLKSRVGLKKARENRNFWVAREWREWAVKFINGKKKRISRLVRIFGKDFLEDIFGYQVTIAMLRPLRFHRLRRARLKKPSGKYRRAPNNSGMKYGIRVPRNSKEASQFYKENGNFLWRNEIFKEMEDLMSMEVFRKILPSL